MLRSTSKFFFFFSLSLVSGSALVSAICFCFLESESPVDIFFLAGEEGKTCSSGLGRHSDDVEYLGNIGLVMRSLEIYDYSE